VRVKEFADPISQNRYNRVRTIALQANLAAGGSNGKCRIRNDWVNSV
jgi:hypothetical protein